jgi:hypothetical protein
VSRLSYSYPDADIYEAIDGSFVVIVDDRPVSSHPTREAAKKWIAEEFGKQSAWKRQAKWKNGGHDD